MEKKRNRKNIFREKEVKFDTLVLFLCQFKNVYFLKVGMWEDKSFYEIIVDVSTTSLTL